MYTFIILKGLIIHQLDPKMVRKNSTFYNPYISP
jgi:hypothetical protein